MSTRTLESPFRETQWDQRLDKMLDDLKTTVTPDSERPSSRKDASLSSLSYQPQPDKSDTTFLDIFRSSSRSESRTSNRSGIEDGGHMKHHHKEYTSPDKSTRVVTDQFEYESGDPNKQYQKKVMKSTYSNYKVTGDLSSNLDSLRQGPDPSIMEAARVTSDQQTDNTKVVSASQKVANKLVDALSNIGPDGRLLDGESSPSTIASDYSTLTRLSKNIKELDSMLEAMDEENGEKPLTITAAVATHRTTLVQNMNEQRQHSQHQIEELAQQHTQQLDPCQKSPTKSDHESSIEKQLEESIKVEATSVQQSQSDAENRTPKTDDGEKPTKSKGLTEGPTPVYSTNSYSSSKTTRNRTTGITNGKLSYDDEDDAELIHEPMAGEVRKIVWRNRFEKTYEGQDGTPSITIEEESRRRNKNMKTTTSTLSTMQPQPPQRGPLPRGSLSPRQLQLQYAVYWPNLSPNISPGGQSWADPIPMPTPPQLSPKGEPGVAYVYTYGQPGSQVQHMPPANFVRGGSMPPSEGAPSPTPSGTQPIIYHYSYHYNIQPGQPLPDGVLPHPPGSHPPQQPALQMAPPSDTVPGKLGTQPGSTASYDYRSHTTKTNQTNQTISDTTTNVHHHHHPPGTVSRPHDPHGRPHSPHELRDPHDRPGDGRFPKDSDPRPFPAEGPNSNISITINKSSSSHVTHSKDYPPGGPSTSTPFPTTGRRSRSSSPDRYTSRDPGTGPYGTGPHGPGPHGSGPHGTITNVTHTTTRHEFSDSLDRVRRPPNEGLPFPDTSPIKHRAETKFPKRVDDLMTSLSDSEDGPNSPVDVRPLNGPKPPHEKEPLISTKVSSSGTEVALNEKKTGIKREESKNIAGPPIYYPPGHHQLFDESMHTMTLKENKRRGMAKWRMEKASGYKESASSSESKGGMAMVPVCLPLCCGAACAIM